MALDMQGAPVLVMDNGAGVVKLGFAGEEAPRL